MMPELYGKCSTTTNIRYKGTHINPSNSSIVTCVSKIVLIKENPYQNYGLDVVSC